MEEVDLALLVLRVATGLTLAAHGFNKIKGGIGGTAGWFDSIGMRPGRFHAWSAALGEILSGLLLAAGLLTSFAALGFVGLMVVAGYTVHLRNGFFIIKEGWEYVFILAIVAITLAMLGPGEWSIDHALGITDELDGYVGLVISAVGGTLAAVFLLAVFFRPPKDA